MSLSQTAPCNTRPGINYLHLYDEDAQAIPARQFDAIMGAIAENIGRRRVLLHCGSGISRAPVMTAAYMHAVGYKDLDTASVEIAGLRPIIAPSAILVASVKEHLRRKTTMRKTGTWRSRTGRGTSIGSVSSWNRPTNLPSPHL